MSKFYIVYEIVENEKGATDFENRFDTDNRKTLASWLEVTLSNLNKYTCKDLDNINCKLKDNKYFIFKDYE